jgi:hypothetical protein
VESRVSPKHRFAGAESRPQISDREFFWGQRSRLSTDRYVEGQRRSHCEELAGRVMNGGNAKAMPRCLEKNLRE